MHAFAHRLRLAQTSRRYRMNPKTYILTCLQGAAGADKPAQSGATMGEVAAAQAAAGAAQREAAAAVAALDAQKRLAHGLQARADTRLRVGQRIGCDS